MSTTDKWYDDGRLGLTFADTPVVVMVCRHLFIFNFPVCRTLQSVSSVAAATLCRAPTFDVTSVKLGRLSLFSSSQS